MVTHFREALFPFHVLNKLQPASEKIKPPDNTEDEETVLPRSSKTTMKTASTTIATETLPLAGLSSEKGIQADMILAPTGTEHLVHGVVKPEVEKSCEHREDVLLPSAIRPADNSSSPRPLTNPHSVPWMLSEEDEERGVHFSGFRGKSSPNKGISSISLQETSLRNKDVLKPVI
ncbi:unnamed protein product [Protopolystoma xenopodis]|uniref:Uncharacterized protein n=1 Tax=Protopolystoma xenopodis TaxID=117903 RepID=A0A448WML4_9PLAT|nr:unnamed protein product [Protopolystoma xenopodis]